MITSYISANYSTYLNTILSFVEGPPAHHLNLLLLLGIAVFGGTIGAKLFQKLRIPQVVGYIMIGLIVGETGLKLVQTDVIEILEPLSLFALGIIGFMIGGELKLDLFKKHGKQFTVILLAEGIAAFLFVGLASGLLMYLFTKNLHLSVAVGVILGAISSATDPATTLQVLWEYKTRGIVTTTAISIVALDDALALALYGIGTSLADMLMAEQRLGLLRSLGIALYEVVLAVFVGVATGIILRSILLRIHESDKVLTFTLGSVLLVIGLSKTIGVDIILSSMGLGITLVNLAPRRSLKAFDLIKGFSPPIYILFFVFVGAKLQIGGLSLLVLLLVLAYVVARSIGKIAGCYLGTIWSGGRETVKKYLGLCLFAQGGVAIGLSIVASSRFDAKISELIVLVVTATTFIVQIAGPLFIKMGVDKAGEIGLNVTEEDLIKTYTVSDMTAKDLPVIFAGMSLAEVIDHVGRTENSYYPVVGNDRKFIGIITLDGIRKIFRTQELHGWLVAMDIAQPIVAFATPQMPLAEAMDKMQNLYMQYLPVVQSKESGIFEGILDYQAIQRNLTAEILSRQQKADSMHVTAAT